ncbi:hypothetical protein NG799_00580 [Laspinema sp. D1]|uniref:Uncharacterized protein n=1 Tax=Laspinema palackyanum D2a TaxID=2953684 RepID=A0ABT2MJA9_9CYAN|nr:hypothetical protein [Laspinema sp. D2a]
MNTFKSGIHLNDFSYLSHEGLAGFEPDQGNNFMMNQGTGVLLIRREPKRSACVVRLAALILHFKQSLWFCQGRSQNFLFRPSSLARVPRVYTHFPIQSKPARATLHRIRWNL